MEWFLIKDLSEFTTKARAIVFNNFGIWDSNESELDILIDTVSKDEEEEFNQILSQNESIIIVKSIARKQKHKKTNKIRYILNEKLFIDVIESLNDRMVSNILNSLVSKGLVESSFDSEINDFVFWINNENTNNKETPETD